MGIGFRERAAENREILGKDVDQATLNPAEAGDEAVTRGALLLHPEIGAAVADELIKLLERAFIQQQVDALARSELPGLVLALAALGTAPGFRFGGAAPQLFETVVLLAVDGHSSSSLRGSVHSGSAPSAGPKMRTAR